MKKSILIFTLFIATQVSLKAQNWALQNSGTTAQLNDVFFVDDLNGWAVGNGNTCVHTTDGGTTWSAVSITNDTRDFLSIDFPSSSVGLIGSHKGRVYKTTDGGSTWAEIPYYGSGGTPNFNGSVIKDLHFIDANNGWGLSGTRGVWVSTDGGSTWNMLVDGSGGVGTGTNAIYFTDATHGFMAADDNSSRDHILHSTDGGTNWSQTNIGESGDFESVYFVDSDTGYVSGFIGRVYKTTDGGSTWTQLQKKTNDALQCIVFPDAQNGIVVGNHGVILETYDFGASFTKLTSPTADKLEKVFARSATLVWAVGWNGTIIKKDGGSTTSVMSLMEESITIYPNPTNGLITINNLPENTAVLVFDMLGNLIMEKYTAQINLNGLNSGVYIVRIGTNTQRIILK